MIKRKLSVITTIVGLTVASLAHAQDKPSRLTFDVATIRLSSAKDLTGGIKPLPGGNGYTVKNIPIKLIISLMYRVPMRQISGEPEWVNSDRYDIEAKTDGSYNVDDLHAMFQNLLADRFNLKFHIETKEGNVYALMLDTGGTKMKVNDSPDDYKIPVNFSPEGFVGARVPMGYLCWFLGQQLQNDERPVINRTGLSGNYDFSLSFMPELPPGVQRDNLPPEVLNRPSIFDAVRQQLGLKLVPQKGPVDHYVIDHIDRPSDN
jgi:uncharacterized protein (TIGR03435 family)